MNRKVKNPTNDVLKKRIIKSNQDKKIDIQISEKVYLGLPSNRKRISKREAYKLIDKGYLTIFGTMNDLYIMMGESK